MRRVHVSTLAVAALAMVSQVAAAQGGMDETTRKVEGGGIKVPGWMGKADGAGKVDEAKLTKEGNVFHVTTGPAVTYWNPANKASAGTLRAVVFRRRGVAVRVFAVARAEAASSSGMVVRRV